MRPRTILLGLAICASFARGAAYADSPYPVDGLVKIEKTGRLVSIPGAPLPPLPTESVRDAIAIYRPILAVVRRFGADAALARGLGYLATLHAALGENAKAEACFDEAQSIMESNGITGRDYGWLHNNRGLVRLNQRRYPEAVKLFRAADATLRADTPDDYIREGRAAVLSNLGITYGLLGDVENAEDALLRSLAGQRQSGDEGSRTYAVAQANLAEVYSSMKDYEAARELLEELTRRRNLGSDLQFAVLNNLGYVSYALKDARSAETWLNKALALTRDGSQSRVIVLTNLAAAYVTGGEYEKAREAARQALPLAEELNGKDSKDVAGILGSLGTMALFSGDLQGAEDLLTRSSAILSKHSGTEGALAGVTQTLAVVAQRQGSRDKAIGLGRQALLLEKKTLERILSFGSETQRLAYRANAYPYDQLANLGDATLLADAVIFTKGAVLESLLEERARVRKSTSPADHERLVRIQGLRVELMEKTARGQTRLEVLERELKQEETALAKSVRSRPPSAVRADVDAVQAALERNQVLVEIIRYQSYEDGGRQVPSYGGIVIPRAGLPAWVPLGPSETIDELVTTMLRGLDTGNRGMEPPSGPGQVRPALRELHDRLWEPLAKAFPSGTCRVVLSPDGATHFVPWAALLVDDATFLGERWQLSQVSSGRDLLRAGAKSSGQTLLALADGKGDLPSSRREVEHLAEVAAENGWRATVLVGEKALESRLSQRPAPRILHLATHGDQLAGHRDQPIEHRLRANPMYSGVLLLAGGERARTAWKRGTVLPFSDDGILTAEEVAGLDLGGTWLTVLSACRSGSGDARIGEGVLGLRRGFALAGTEQLLYSLWSVDDESTALFMNRFYERLFAGKDPRAAFNETQAKELRRWRRIEDVDSAVFRAGAFVLSR